MKLFIAGADRNLDLGLEISEQAGTMVAEKKKDELPIFLEHGDSVLSLRAAGSESEYLDKLVTLLLSRAGVGTYDFYVPRKPGLIGNLAAFLKKALWKLLRYQHDRIAFQQNSINIQLTSNAEFMRAEYNRKIMALEKRIAELEACSGRK